MERRIGWQSYIYDDIELVYEKAEKDPEISSLLVELEKLALDEAENCCGYFKMGDQPITKAQFAELDTDTVEVLMAKLGERGLMAFDADISTKTITVRFSPEIQSVMGCTVFNVIHRLEKLDGAFNVIIQDKAVLELQVPAGGKKGLFMWQMLIMRLYPWISVSERTSEDVAEELLNSSAQNSPAPEGADMFYALVHNDTFAKILGMACSEIEFILTNNILEISHEGKKMTAADFEQLDSVSHFRYVMELGKYTVEVDRVICVDYTELMPCCTAVYLLYLAYSGQMKAQIIDAGEGSDVKILAYALTELKPLVTGWSCMIAYPVNIKIGENQGQQSNGAPEKKSIFKKLFKK